MICQLCGFDQPKTHPMRVLNGKPACEPACEPVREALLGDHGTRRVRVLSAPRRIDGGRVVTVAWAEDDMKMTLPDGSVHPAHRKGFSWEEPEQNLRPV